MRKQTAIDASRNHARTDRSMRWNELQHVKKVQKKIKTITKMNNTQSKI
jgi:hypothetical protein